MRLAALRLIEVPGHGLRGLEFEDLGADVVLILGPNGSGKSTARRCVERLLFGTHPELVHARISATFEVAAGDATIALRVEQRDGAIRWTRDGQTVPPPPLPVAARSSCYAIGARDLLDAGAPEQDFAATVRREMAGGYDLAAAREGLVGAALGGAFGRKLAAVVREQTKNLREVEGSLDALAAREETLGDLHRRKEESERAAERGRRIDASLEALQRAQGTIGPRTEEIAEATRALERIAGETRVLRADGVAPEAVDLERAREALRALQAAETELATARRTEAGARGVLETARHALSGVESSTGERPGLAGLRALETAWTRREDARETVTAIQRSIAQLVRAAESPRTADEAASSRRLDAATGDLARWLSNAPRSERETAPWILPALAALAIACAVGAALAPTSPAAVTIALVATAGVGAGALVALLLARRNPDTSEAVRATVEQGFDEHGVDAPDAWDPEAVDERLRALRDARENAARRERDRRDRERLEGELEGASVEMRERVAELAAECDRLGLDASEDGLALIEVARRVNALADAEAGLAGARGVRTEAADDRARRAASVRAALGIPGPDADDEVEDLSELQARHDRAAARARALDDLAGEARQHQELRSRAERARDEARVEADSAAEALGVAPDVPHEEVRERFEPERERLRAVAVERDGLAESITQIETEARLAREGDAWEAARASREAATHALAGAFDERVDALAVEAMLEDVEEEFERTARPEVLERAGRLFGDFTHQRYALVAISERSAADARFAARDADDGDLRDLEELSDGTRMQLLLALRIAFAEQGERGEAVPVTLDEVLTMSDPGRARAVIEALGRLAASGRQVVYLGADPALEADWRAILEAVGHPSPRVVRMEGVEADARGVVHAADLAPVPEPAVPDPSGMTAEEFGTAIGVGLLAPHEDAGALHLFHLLRDDLHALARLARLRVTTLGRWEGLADRGGAARALGDEHHAKTLTARCAAARAVVDAWHESRGRPVGRAELEASGSVSDAYLDRMCDYLGSVGGDAAALVAELERSGAQRDERLRGFRANKVESLRTYLIERGALDTRPPVPPEQQDERARAAAPSLDAVEATRISAAVRAQLERPGAASHV